MSGQDSEDIWINAEDETVANSLARWCKKHVEGQLTLVSGYVSLRGLLSVVPAVRRRAAAGHSTLLLIGVAPRDDAALLLPISEEPALTPEGTGPLAAHRADPELIQQLCQRADRALYGELNSIPATRRTGLFLEDLAWLLDSGALECRRFECGFLHAKAAAADHPRPEIIVSSANLTYAGLHVNDELGARIAPPVTATAMERIGSWWQQAVPYDLGACIRVRRAQHPAELVLLRMLYEAFGNEVDAPVSPIGLVDFQRDGVAQLLAKIDRFGGALDADAVGLGKTLAGGEIARIFLERGDGPILVVCLASLIPMWERYLTEWGLRCDVISYERLSLHYEDVEEHGHTWPRYGLVICDEAHVLRNPLTARMLAIRSLLAAHSPHPKVLLLTATPVNNNAGDLLELLLLADPHLEENWRRGGTFSATRARNRSPEARRLTVDLTDPCALSDLEHAWMLRHLGERMLRRDREFLAAHYPPSPYPGRFPIPEHRRLTYQLSAAMRRLFADVIHAVGHTRHLPADLARELELLVGDHAPPDPLVLAVYQRERYYRTVPAVRPRNPALLALIRILLLKRLESSPAACRVTLTHLARGIEEALADLERGIVRIPRHRQSLALQRRLAMAQGEDLEPDEVDSFLTEYAETPDVIVRPAREFDTGHLHEHLEHDLGILRWLIEDADKAVQDDSKKQVLPDLLAELIRDRRGPKAVVFCSARTATDELGAWLDEQVRRDPRLAALRGRTANLGTLEAPSVRYTQSVVARFAPHHNKIPHRGLTTPPPHDDIDLLVTTDRLALGANLQDAAFCVHYDLTWNPQILGQRFGRIDRLGSRHETVTCYTVQPDAGLDIALHLMEIIARKAMIAAATVGLPTPLYAGSPTRAAPEPVDLRITQPLPGPGLSDSQHAWLGTALRTPAVKEALLALPAAAGGICDATVPTASILFCFHVTDPSHAGNDSTETVFVRINTGDCHGAYSLDASTCMAEPHLDPARFTAHAARHGLLDPAALQPMPTETLRAFWNLIDTARDLIVRDRDIAVEEGIERVRLIAWLYLNPHPAH